MRFQRQESSKFHRDLMAGLVGLAVQQKAFAFVNNRRET